MPSNPSRDWPATGRALVARMLAELSYEQLLRPVPTGRARYEVRLGSGVTYRFAARRGAFDSWRVEPGSVERAADGDVTPAVDPRQLVLDARDELALAGSDLAEVVRELTATWAADVRLVADARTAAELADLPHLPLEGHQTGHPAMVLNKGRLGFSADDLARFAPEARRPLRLEWIAVHEELATYAGVPALDRTQLLAHELDPDTREAFATTLAATVADPDRFVWLPVHPWHWDHAVQPLFAPSIGTGRMVHLGRAPDRYVPLQSVRTLADLDRPDRHHVKLPLLIRNTLVWRGLAPEPTRAAPDVTAWLTELCDTDPFLRSCRFRVLGEVASVTVRHPVYDRVADAPYRYHELLGAVWRQPVDALLDPGERARTLASLLVVDPAGRALVSELVERSGLDAAAWLRRLLAAMLPPLLHCLYQYGLAFCPHGENTVVIFDDRDVPARIAVKDLAEDVNLLPGDRPQYADLSPRAAAVLLRWEPQQLAHSVVSAVLAGHFRFLADVFEDHLDLSPRTFWTLVRAEVETAHERTRDPAAPLDAFGLLAPTVERICLNREQLLGGGFHDRAERDEDFDLASGHVPNPLVALAAPSGREVAAHG